MMHDCIQPSAGMSQDCPAGFWTVGEGDFILR